LTDLNKASRLEVSMPERSSNPGNQTPNRGKGKKPHDANFYAFNIVQQAIGEQPKPGAFGPTVKYGVHLLGGTDVEGETLGRLTREEAGQLYARALSREAGKESGCNAANQALIVCLPTITSKTIPSTRFRLPKEGIREVPWTATVRERH
jgi:hypothetical protein